MKLAALDRDSDAASRWRAAPRTFVALMNLYESNYLRLRWLVGDLQRLCGAPAAAPGPGPGASTLGNAADAHQSSRVEGDCELVLAISERSPYTTTLNLTYRLEDPAAGDAAPLLVPDVTIRVYHDAHLVEALDWAARHGHAGLQALRSRAERERAERELDQRWARNMMLNKWLEYCLERGHQFPPTAQRPTG
jgi:uncharacterized protein YqiB (DUF1249 family)